MKKLLLIVLVVALGVVIAKRTQVTITD